MTFQIAIVHSTLWNLFSDHREIQNVAEIAVNKRSQVEMNGELLRNDELILEMLRPAF